MALRTVLPGTGSVFRKNPGGWRSELKWAELAVELEPDVALGYVHTMFRYLYAASRRAPKGRYTVRNTAQGSRELGFRGATDRRIR